MSHNLLDFIVNFSHFTITSPYNDDSLMMNSLFWIRANFHHPVDLPDTTGLDWSHHVPGEHLPLVQNPTRHSAQPAILSCLVSDLLVSSSALAWVSPVFTSSLWVPDSTLILRPTASALAPSSLVSTVAHHPTGSTGLPRPSCALFLLLCSGSGLIYVNFGLCLLSCLPLHFGLKTLC